MRNVKIPKEEAFSPSEKLISFESFQKSPYTTHFLPLKICLRFLANDQKITEKNGSSITSHLVIYVQQIQIGSWFSEGNPIFCWKKSKVRFFSSYSNLQMNFPYVVRFHIYKNQQLHQPKPQLSNPRPHLLFYFILLTLPAQYRFLYIGCIQQWFDDRIQLINLWHACLSNLAITWFSISARPSP